MFDFGFSFQMLNLNKRKEIVIQVNNNEIFYNKQEVDSFLVDLKEKESFDVFKNNSSLTRSFSIDNLLLTNGCYYRPSAFFFTQQTPDVFDYIHFAFCYFFLTATLLLFWLVYTLDVILNRVDYIEPTFETRGFSRAQTGDSITAVIPLTWSLSMIIHAGSYSSNFDENVDNCDLSLFVIAYQWGWNYVLLESDINKKYSSFDYNNYFSKKKSNKSDFEILSEGLCKFVGIEYKSRDCRVPVFPIIFFNESNIFFNFVPIEIKKTTDTFYLDMSKKILNKLLEKKGNNIWNIFPSVTIDDDDDFLFIDRLEISSARNSYMDVPSIRLLYDKSLNHNIIDHRLVINTGLVLPINTPIHIVCASKDVIHSWAIPGLLVKIDCIPGFNCHRRLFIKWSGIFWGQCMEVCGRYHHWMPILIKTVYSEIFVMWAKTCLENS